MGGDGRSARSRPAVGMRRRERTDARSARSPRCPRHPQTSTGSFRLPRASRVPFREPVSAEVKAAEGLRSADRRQPRAGHRPHQPSLAAERAGQRHDHQLLAIEVALGMRRRGDSRRCTSELYAGELKAAAGAEEWRACLQAMANRVVRRVVVAVRRPRQQPDPVDAVQVPPPRCCRSPLTSGRSRRV